MNDYCCLRPADSCVESAILTALRFPCRRDYVTSLDMAGTFACARQYINAPVALLFRQTAAFPSRADLSHLRLHCQSTGHVWPLRMAVLHPFSAFELSRLAVLAGAAPELLLGSVLPSFDRSQLPATLNPIILNPVNRGGARAAAGLPLHGEGGHLQLRHRAVGVGHGGAASSRPDPASCGAPLLGPTFALYLLFFPSSLTCARDARAAWHWCSHVGTRCLGGGDRHCWIGWLPNLKLLVQQPPCTCPAC